MKTVLTVAGSDPSCGAGLQIDISVFRALGLHPLSVVASITVQNSLGVKKAVAVETSLVMDQLEALMEDFPVKWLKTGLLGSGLTIESLARFVEDRQLNLVVDPVMVSTSGFHMAGEDEITALREVLLPVTKVITPNIPEAEVLTGLKYRGQDSIEEICDRLRQMGPQWIILKGGHGKDSRAEDILYDGTIRERLSTVRSEGTFHGTGCVFSAALTGYLALDKDIIEATRGAKEYVSRAIVNAYLPGKGMAYLKL